MFSAASFETLQNNWVTHLRIRRRKLQHLHVTPGAVSTHKQSRLLSCLPTAAMKLPASIPRAPQLLKDSLLFLSLASLAPSWYFPQMFSFPAPPHIYVSLAITQQRYIALFLFPSSIFACLIWYSCCWQAVSYNWYFSVHIFSAHLFLPLSLQFGFWKSCREEKAVEQGV